MSTEGLWTHIEDAIQHKKPIRITNDEGQKVMFPASSLALVLETSNKLEMYLNSGTKLTVYSPEPEDTSPSDDLDYVV